MPWSRQQAHQARKKQRGAAPRNRVKNLGQSVSLEHQSGAEGGRKKNNFSGSEKLFFQKVASSQWNRDSSHMSTRTVVISRCKGKILVHPLRKKNNFSGSGHVARIKHVGRSKPLLEKTTFRAPKSCFFWSLWVTLFALKTDISTFLTKSSGHVARIKHFGRSKPLLKKTTFRSPKNCFLICTLEGSPFAVALWAAGKGTWKA